MARSNFGGGIAEQVPDSGKPDPSVLTTESMLREVENSEKQANAKRQAIHQRIDGIDRATELLHDDLVRFPTEVQKEIGHLKELIDVRIEAEQKVSTIRETYRLELKTDAKEALATAMTAAEKAVQAALAAAEKARDQQTIASQLATDKAEKAFIEALAQQQQTFTVAIANVVSGIDETKEGIAELRNIKRGGQQNTASIYAAFGFVSTVLIILTILAANGFLASGR